MTERFGFMRMRMSADSANGNQGKDKSGRKQEKRKSPLPPVFTTPDAPDSGHADPHGRGEPQDRGGR